MPQQSYGTADPRFDVLIEGTGQALQVQEYTYAQDFLGATDSFSFAYYSDAREDLRGLEMQAVTLRIDDRPQMYGRIEATERGGDGSSVHCEGRDYIADLVECNIDPKCVIKDGMSLHDALLLLFGPCGITTTVSQSSRLSKRTGKSIAAGAETLSKLGQKLVKDLKPDAGRGVYEVGEELCARFGYVIQPATDRTAIVIQRPTYEAPALGRIVRTIGSPNKNLVLRGHARRDYSHFPTYAMFTGKQGSPTEVGGAKGTLTTRDMQEFLTAWPAEMRIILQDNAVWGRSDPTKPKAITNGECYRLLYFRDDKVGKTSEQVSNAIMRAVADRLKATLRYTCKLRGHTNPATGYTWCTDTLLDVDDDMADVHETLWVARATFANSRKDGPTTELEMIRPGTFQVYAEGQ